MKIVDYRFVNEGIINGYFTLNYGKIGITGCTHFYREGKHWFTFPQRKYEKDGNVEYIPVILVTKQANNELQNEFIATLLRDGLYKKDENGNVINYVMPQTEPTEIHDEDLPF
ncbi:hypothetical protein [Bacillus cereus]|uniref:hypothetical protein n=1 Tax=Bacillus cereus TaxID=1396 RepID=UPI00187A1B7E|nr:hypothetical protein [Bacillus cereus]MBE7099926.1 hypothetical protein [Bacillus cereus]MBE7106953.1 hypothetical protein [Bacillus cereus]MBE7123966.1 hypothetical protein [Bacillus cereus]